MKQHTHEWLKSIKEQIIPPLCVEIFLKNGRSYFILHVLFWDDSDDTAIIRIYDLRDIDDQKELREAINRVKDRSEFGDPAKIHDKLDWANLRIPKDEIVYIIEWHDKFWPIKESIGFRK